MRTIHKGETTVQIQEVFEADEKSRICNAILRALPDWFGIETAIIGYINDTRAMSFYAAYANGAAIGFAAVKNHNPYTSEVYVMGILPEHHNKGIGRALIDFCEAYCADKGSEFLTVKTLDEAREDEGYEKTRLFYLAMGFRPLEVFPLLWDESNPCLFMAKYLRLRPPKE